MKDATLRQAKKILEIFEDTPSEQVQALLGSGLLADLRDTNIAAIERDSFRKFLGLRVINLLLLKPLGTVKVPASRKFEVKEKFIVNTSHRALVKISYIERRFSEWFLKKIEEPRSQTTLCYAQLLKGLVDGPVLAELGNTAETTLAEIYALMKRQPDSDEVGVLLTNGYANIFYVRDTKDNLCAVHVVRRDDGWLVEARSAPFPDMLADGRRIFFRNS